MFLCYRDHGLNLGSKAGIEGSNEANEQNNFFFQTKSSKIQGYFREADVRVRAMRIRQFAEDACRTPIEIGIIVS